MAERERIRRRLLPHWDVPGATYFVTSCLAGSIPAQGLLDVSRYRDELRTRGRPDGISTEEWETRKQKLLFARLDHWLDNAPAIRWFEKPELAAIIVDAFFFGAETRYDLLGYAVMPSHVHWVFRPRTEWIESQDFGTRSPRQAIVHAFNLHTAKRCNGALKRTGEFWQHEGYDHWARDEGELERILLYVDDNPSKAKLVVDPAEWVYSSAWYRKQHRIELGQPLTRLAAA